MDEDIIEELKKEIQSINERLIAIEIDKKLIAYLREEFKDHQNITIVNADFLSADISRLRDVLDTTGSIKVIANLPYYITTPIIFKLRLGIWFKIIGIASIK